MCILDVDPPVPAPRPADAPPPPLPKAFRKRQPGEPPIPPLFVKSTFSLGVILMIGATAILILSLVNRSDFNDASLSDFESLGWQGCRIISAASYRTADRELNALNRACVEEWQYNVLVVAGENNNSQHKNATFVSAPLSQIACRSSCDSCPTSRLQGQNFYPDVDPRVFGRQIDNATLVGCWASTIPAEELSDFYGCSRTNSIDKDDSDDYCYQLMDPTDALKDEMDSYEMAMLGVYIAYGAGLVVMGIAAYWWWTNNRALAHDRVIMAAMEEEEDAAAAEATTPP